MTIFSDIRDGCRYVAEHARFVRIDDVRLAEYARGFPVVDLGKATLDPATHYVGQGKDTLLFILALDAINFGSGYFPHLKKRLGPDGTSMSGYFTVAAGLNDWFRADGPPTAERLEAMTRADCARIFGQEGGDAVALELMGLFAGALKDLGALLRVRFDGEAARLVETARHKAANLIRILRQMPYFDDVTIWRARAVPFMKRAQLTAADLSLAFDRQGWGRFDDLEQLTIFADNLVPHVLRVDGVLVYDPALLARIAAGEALKAGSPEEIEIRAAAVHAVELLNGHLRAAGHARITSMDLDYLLWNRGQAERYKRAPRHRARSVFY